MKRIGNLFEKVYTQANADIAFWKGTAKKRTHPTVREYWKDGITVEQYRAGMSFAEVLDEEKVDALLTEIRTEIQAGRYQHETPRRKREFCTSKAKGQKGKWRDLYCPSLKDHIFQHMVMQVSMPIFARGMYRYCCGNVPNRGGADVVKAVTKWCRQDNGWRYFVELDIRKFFEHIREEDVMEALRKKCKDTRLLGLHQQILRSGPKPVPIGYYISPWYANFLLEPLDHFIVEGMYKVRRGKRIPMVRHYIRYVDNMLLMGSSKRGLETAIREVEKFLKDRWGLEIKQSWEIRRIAEYDENGKIQKGTYRIHFIGYTYDRTRTIMMDGNFLSTRRLAHRMKLRERKEGTVALNDCMSYVSKRGFLTLGDHARFDALMDKEFSKYTARKVISNAAKCGIFGTA